MSRRRTHSPECKAKVAIEAINGCKTLEQIAAEHALPPIQVNQWKKQSIGRLQMELEWLKKSRQL
ncbi:MAG: transposase [Cyanobacteriota bacterium]